MHPNAHSPRGAFIEGSLYNYKNHTNGNSWKTFAYRFTKHNPSSMRKEGIPDEKRRKTKICPANLCFMKIKVSRFITKKKVYIERYQDSPDHTHTIEESEKLKRSQFVRNLVEQEAIKNYLPPAIVNAIKEYAIEKLDLSSKKGNAVQKSTFIETLKASLGSILNAEEQ
ncbi:hypothetical protein Glove_99g141 [Diversispora epigaea]|uniref:FAR1 domain-containing protein n=1 Tax=Diversispora epigaea TaxID=1348612 RepID=A0A397J532_9GLOM|nr:hypothetical protein Glove_99g141 [Diversispora epigaea]